MVPCKCKFNSWLIEYNFLLLYCSSLVRRGFSFIFFFVVNSPPRVFFSHWYLEWKGGREPERERAQSEKHWWLMWERDITWLSPPQLGRGRVGTCNSVTFPWPGKWQGTLYHWAHLPGQCFVFFFFNEYLKVPLENCL